MSPLPRFRKLSQEKRRAILDAAASEFAAHGFEGASFNRIIQASGISKGAMYYYFADKADAYEAVLEDVMDRVGVELSVLPEPKDAAAYWETIALGMERLTVAFFADQQLGALARGLYARIGDPTYRRMMSRGLDFTEGLIERGQALGAVRDDLPLDLLAEITTAMLVSMDRWFANAMETHPSDELMTIAPRVLDLIRDLLEPERKNP